MWESGRRLPPNWRAIRRRVLERDGYVCVLCGHPANQVDHIGDKDDHSDANLRSLCEFHHARRTSAQGNAARRRVRSGREEKHPGIM